MCLNDHDKETENVFVMMTIILGKDHIVLVSFFDSPADWLVKGQYSSCDKFIFGSIVHCFSHSLQISNEANTDL